MSNSKRIRSMTATMLTVAAIAALGLAAARHYLIVRDGHRQRLLRLYNDPRIGGDEETLDQGLGALWSDPGVFDELRGAVYCAVAVYAVALLVVRTSRATHNLQTLVRQPGTAASLSCLVVLTCRASALLVLFAVGRSSHTRLVAVTWTSLTDGLGEQVGGSVLAVWVALYLSRSLRIHWDWVETLGVALGAIWSIQFFARAVVLALTGVVV
jgi:hypothetical protein